MNKHQRDNIFMGAHSLQAQAACAHSSTGGRHSEVAAPLYILHLFCSARVPDYYSFFFKKKLAGGIWRLRAAIRGNFLSFVSFCCLINWTLSL